MRHSGLAQLLTADSALLPYSELVRQILRRALMTSDKDAGGLGGRVHQYFVEANGVDLVLPERSAPRASPDFSGSDA